LNDIRRKLNAALRAGNDDDDGWPQSLRIIMDDLPAAGVFQFQGDAAGKLKLSRRMTCNWLSVTDTLIEKLREAAVAACHEDQIKAVPLSDTRTPAAYLVPSVNLEASTDCLGIIVTQPRPTEEQVAILNMLGAYLAAGRMTRRSIESESDAVQAAAITELLGQLTSREELSQACGHLADELQRHFQCQRVVIGMIGRRGARCRTIGISQLDEFSASSELTRTMDLALQEAVLRQETIVWKPSQPGSAGPAQRKVAEAFAARTFVAGCLTNAKHQVVGAWLFFGHTDFAAQPGLKHAIDTASEPIGNVLDLLRESEPSRFVRGARKLWANRGGRQTRAVVATAALTLAALLFPFPYAVKCDFTLRPVQRRFLAAPFDAVLQHSHCKPGDLVKADQLLAELDGREIRMELASLSAEREHAAKQRQVALAGRNTADAQQAQLKMERIDLRIQLLQGRQENLQLRSPINGIVLRGDLENAIGVPVAIGQTLFEIAPLDRLVAELSIPDEEIHHVILDGQVTLCTDAAPGETRRGRLIRIHPVAEIRDSQNVFVGESVLDNAGGKLRPGMHGRAKVEGGRRPLAWILFHKPWRALARLWNV
jgi:hypothetical protein